MIAVSALLDGWAAGLFVGLLILPVVILLLTSVLRPLLEIRTYADEILDAGLGITRNLDGIDEAVRTHELATAVPELATAYLKRRGAA